jgi:hypothetical protein
MFGPCLHYNRSSSRLENWESHFNQDLRESLITGRGGGTFILKNGSRALGIIRSTFREQDQAF